MEGLEGFYHIGPLEKKDPSISPPSDAIEKRYSQNTLSKEENPYVDHESAKFQYGAKLKEGKLEEAKLKAANPIEPPKWSDKVVNSLKILGLSGAVGVFTIASLFLWPFTLVGILLRLPSYTPGTSDTHEFDESQEDIKKSTDRMTTASIIIAPFLHGWILCTEEIAKELKKLDEMNPKQRL